MEKISDLSWRWNFSESSALDQLLSAKKPTGENLVSLKQLREVFFFYYFFCSLIYIQELGLHSGDSYDEEMVEDNNDSHSSSFLESDSSSSSFSSPIPSPASSPSTKKLKYQKPSGKSQFQEGLTVISNMQKRWDDYLDRKSSSFGVSKIQIGVEILNELSSQLGQDYIPLLLLMREERNCEVLIAMLPEQRLPFLLSLLKK